MSSPDRAPLANPRFWLVAGLLLLPFMITNQSLWIDEGNTALYAIQPDLPAWWHRLREDPAADSQMPFSLFVVWLNGWVWGTREWQMRAVNLLWGGLALWGMFRVGRRLRLPWLPLLLAIQPYFWFYTDEARPYALQIACGAWLLLALVEFYATEAAGETWAWLFAGAGYFLFLSTMLALVPLAAIAGAGGVAAWKARWKPSRKALLILLGGALASIPTAGYYCSTLLRGAKGAQLWQVDLKFFVYVLYEYSGIASLGPPTEEIRALARSAHILHTLAAHWYQFVLPILGFALLLVVMISGWRRRPAGISSATGVGLALVLGTDALIFITASLLLQKAFWARHLAPVFPFYVTLLGLALAGARALHRPVMRWTPVLVCSLLVLSALNLRLSPAWRKEDYRSAAHVARQALAENKSVWWVAAENCATYYHLEYTFGQMEPGKICLQLDLTKNLPAPDMIIYSRPDLNVRDAAVEGLIERNNYQVAARFKSFVIWVKPGESPEPHSRAGPGA